MYIDFVLGYLWAFCFVIGTSLWILTYPIFHHPIGFTPVPAWHGAVVSVTCLVQFAAALAVNHRYDSKLWRTFFWVPWYPLFFFCFGALTVAWTAPKGLLGRLELAGRWKSPAREKVILGKDEFREMKTE